MLRIKGLNAWYGRSHVLQGIDLNVEAGEIVALIGRNGAGKTTTLRAIMGLMSRRSGNVFFEGVDISGRAPHERFRMGIGYVPEERRIVHGLTVRENLRLGLLRSANRDRETQIIDGIANRFPRLGERLSQEAITMSGGEQQMLAIARALVSEPKLLMLDEPTEGIMPVLVDEMFELFSELKRSGTTIVLVEQNVEMALEVADRGYILDQGTIVHQDSARAMLADEAIQERYCTV